MKIIKSGDRKKSKRFACSMCGCVFEAEGKEYNTTYTSERGESLTVHSVNCPECKSLVQVFEY